VKYLISSDEREAKNNPLWREVAEGGIWDQEFVTHPPPRPPRPSSLLAGSCCHRTMEQLLPVRERFPSHSAAQR